MMNDRGADCTHATKNPRKNGENREIKSILSRPAYAGLWNMYIHTYISDVGSRQPTPRYEHHLRRIKHASTVAEKLQDDFHVLSSVPVAPYIQLGAQGEES